MSEQMDNEKKPPQEEEQNVFERIEVAGNQLVDQITKLIREGNVRRIILRDQDGKTFMEIPLTAGVVVGGVITLAAPLLAALGALAALVARVRIEVVREEQDTEKAEAGDEEKR